MTVYPDMSPHSSNNGFDLLNFMGKILSERLNGQMTERVPLWFMRQAGRHLPEYRDIRQKAPNFLELCYTPELAVEITLQPIRRYGVDGAILFADILLVLDAMGLDVKFEPGIGPVIGVVSPEIPVPKYSIPEAVNYLSPVFQTVAGVKKQLPDTTTLIGFAGAPWTVALYAIEGRGKTDKTKAKLWAYQHPQALQTLLDAISSVTVEYLIKQADAGADALMLFDSWAGELPHDLFHKIIIEPTQKIVASLRRRGISLPIIGFPKGVGQYLHDFVEAAGVNCVGLGTDTHPNFVNAALPVNFPVQGHLDPLALLAGGAHMEKSVSIILNAYQNRPHIFNLGHGVYPDTPIPHVERVVSMVREFRGL